MKRSLRRVSRRGSLQVRNDINLKAPPPKKIMENRLDRDILTRHFIALAQGHRPERRGKLNLITIPKGGKGEEPKKKSEDKLYMVTPIAQAVEQAKSDLKEAYISKPSMTE